jgi:hypothetical protein
MSLKAWVWIGMFVGSTVAGFVPLLWGGSLLSMTSFVASFLGGIAGVWAGYELHKRF